MTAVSKYRLLFLRAVYALLAIGMGSIMWPAIITGSGDWSLMPGVVKCMLGAMTLLALLGIRYPLKMLPLLFWEMAWKVIWLLAVALPAWQSEAMDNDTLQTAIEAGVVILVFAAVPWRYVFAHYIKAESDKAMKAAAA